MTLKDEKGRIYLDTFVFMDILSGDAAMSEKAYNYVKEAEKIGAVVSVVLFTELSFHLRKRKSREKTEEILFYIQSLPNIEFVPVSDEIATTAGLLRAKYRRMKLTKRFTYFDCVHIATALNSGCKKFVTGDRGFKDIQEVTVEIYG
ncbi:PIN domain-containing protein [archaeon]|nr:PIN domain-containing protein [archaeon]